MASRQQIDWPTMAGWGALLMPLLTMWHEIGGHAAACAVQGGRVATIGAFYVDCTGLSLWPDAVVACAGVIVNMALSLIAYAAWRRSESHGTRLLWWLIWVSEAFVAAGYFCFSGVTGAGDLGTGAHGALPWLPMPIAWRGGELALGIVAYILLVRAAIRGLTAMLGSGRATEPARKRIAHTYYIACGAGAFLVGLLNPVGLFITIMSAAASSFGGLAGFISIGFAAGGPDAPRPFVVARNPLVIVGGLLVLATFAIVLGPSVHP